MPRFQSFLPYSRFTSLQPSNFLDRDSLGALAVAIKAFQGGVVLVTHHREFSEELCSETWSVDAGMVSTTGGSWKTDVVEKPLAADEVIDAYGNVIKVQQKLTGKAARKAAKDKAKRRKAGEDVSDDDFE
jgi:elongation factor 3